MTDRSRFTSRATTGPTIADPDDAVYDAIADLMSNGRTSRLYRALVRDKKIAAYSAGFTGLPGNKYPHLFAFYAFPLPGHKTEEVAEAIHAEIERLKKEDISDDELKMIRTRAKANLLRGLDDNEGLASSARPVPGPLWRLARTVPPGGESRQGKQGGYPARRQSDFCPHQPDRGDYRNHAAPPPAAAQNGGGQ